MAENIKKYLLLWLWNLDLQTGLLRALSRCPHGGCWGGMRSCSISFLRDALTPSASCCWSRSASVLPFGIPRNQPFSLFLQKKFESSKEVIVWTFGEVGDFSGTETHRGLARPGSPGLRTSYVAEPDASTLNTCREWSAFLSKMGKLAHANYSVSFTQHHKKVSLQLSKLSR